MQCLLPKEPLARPSSRARTRRTPAPSQPQLPRRSAPPATPPSLGLRRLAGRRHVASSALPELGESLAALSSDTEAAGFPVAIHVGLGLTAALFVATFFVAPSFRASFKEEQPWEDIYAVLAASGVTSVTPRDASKRRAVLLDVRLPGAPRQLPGATAVPLYISITGFSFPALVRRAAFLFFGVAGSELNPAWLAQVQAVVPKNAEVVVACDMGGSLENRPSMKYGFQSRSLKAYHFLKQAGYRNVRHLKGGVDAWAREGLPLADD